MFDHDGVPSGRVFMFALSRPAYVGAPPVTPPAWASPRIGSFSPSGRTPKLKSWAFHVASVKPSPYDQSCMRLCIANRFVEAASMSLPPGVNTFGLQLASNQV